ncbi:Interferon- developmental regulator 1 [Tieghemiomyces parasiticus]|uniref:Interferon- developmental regulator 1 n=1 Tax=Tieghemiomyces parasiticus TaxID=78921 RepID=A0A9W8DIX7_9FUNG|nr:Interferon- developmental regulator 1 [Tieghemiomyces parasiticus]
MSLLRQSLRQALSNAGTAKGSGSGSMRKSTPSGSRRSTPTASRAVSEDEQSDSGGESDSDESLVSHGHSVASDEGGLSGEAPASATWEADIRGQIDQLTEKRVSTREEALQWLVRVMSLCYTADTIESSQESLFDSLRRCIRAPKTARESLLAARAMALWFVAVGVGEEARYQELSDFLRPHIKSLRVPATKAQCILTLALACFIANGAGGDPFAAIDLIQYFLTTLLTGSTSAKETPEVQEAALVSFGLLFTMLDRAPRQMEQLFDEAGKSHLRALRSDHLPVRTAAGQNLALMYDMLRQYGGADHLTLAGQTREHDELVELIGGLATDSSRRRSKKERHDQRAVFREVQGTVVDGEDPTIRFRVGRAQLVFDDWAQIHRYHAFRTVLNEGLNVHFQQNPLLPEVFGDAFERFQYGGGGASGDGSERVVVSTKSHVAKERAIQKTKQRDQRYNATHGLEELSL